MNLTFLQKIHAWWTRTEGLHKSGNYRVIYPDGKKSVGMPFGNAVDYQELFGGSVEKIK